jgi:anaerobic magnesium-protoporphyrin IX monomethyl ester cyclase
MASLLFASSFFYKLDPKQWSFHQPYPPLGTLLAAAVARELDHDVSLFDATLASSPEEIVPLLQSKPSIVIIYDDGFNYLTKMCLTVMREASFAMIRLAKIAGSTVVVCGSDSSDRYDKYFDEGADYIVRGEGEETLKHLLSALCGGSGIESMPGVAYRLDGNTVVNPARPVIRQLDELPMPAWDLVDIESYRAVWLSHHGYFSMNVATTRGCPYKCNWCAKPIYGNRYNSRSPQKVAEEISFLIKKYQAEHFWMCDDIFGLKPGWVQQFRDEVRKRKLVFRYKIQSRVDLLLERDTVDALKESGAETVWVGAESGSQKILDAMDKGTRVAQIYEATRMLKEKGIKVSFFLQFGYPGEIKVDIDATLNMVLDLMPDEIGISVSYPLPGTVFYDNVKSQLSIKQNWRDSNDLAMMFHNTYSPGFYRILYHYIHGCYRLKRGVNYLSGWLRKPLATLPDTRRILSVPYYFLASAFHGYRLRKTS